MSPLRAARTATPNRDTPSACAALSPFDRGDFDRSYPCRWAAPPRMKIIPLLWRGAGVGRPDPEGCLLPLPRGDFDRSSHFHNDETGLNLWNTRAIYTSITPGLSWARLPKSSRW